MSEKFEQSKRNDVALRAGVSGATVSYVFSGKRTVSSDLRQRVLEAAEALNYHPDMVAASMRARKTNTIAVLTDDITSPLQMEVIRSLQECAMDKGYFVNICGGIKNLNRYIENFISRKVDGVFLSVDPAMVNDDYIERLLERDIRVIITSARGFCDERVCGLELNFVTGVEMLVAHLRELGHKDIAFLSCFDWDFPSDHRLPAFYDQMKRQLGVENPAVVMGSRPYSSNISKGYELAIKLIDSKKRFTAVMCTNDMMAIGAMRALQERGYKVPADVSVAGMDDIVFAKASYPALTTISHRSEFYGRRVFEILYRNLCDRKDVARDIVEPSLVLRESTARAKV